MMKSSNRAKVFISYSHKDDKFLETFLPHIRYYERNKLIDFWTDKKIKPGADWKREIENALASALIAVLLISVDFLDSQFIQDNELPPLLISAEKKGVTILPVILRPCSLPESLSRFQAVNNPSMPVAKMKGYQREELWVKVTSAIVDAMSSQKSTVNSVLKQSDLKAEDHEDYVALHKDEPIDIERGQKETTLENDLADQQGLIKQSVRRCLKAIASGVD